ncbi:hypothetical protein D3C84_936730 [compost metagenome]
MKVRAPLKVFWLPNCSFLSWRRPSSVEKRSPSKRCLSRAAWFQRWSSLYALVVCRVSSYQSRPASRLWPPPRVRVLSQAAESR